MIDHQADPATPRPTPLTVAEQRILGVLIEKQKTTPDVYPMTINGLVAGCNQKSNRDPVLNLIAEEVEATLKDLNDKGLVVRVMSGRSDKWKHVLYENWNVDKVELAILAELFLRGPQTEGELRSRVARMDAIEDLEVLRALLRKLTERGFVVYLTPEGRRGTTVTHGCQNAELIEQFRKQFTEGVRIGETAGPAIHPRSGDSTNELALLRKELGELRLSVEALAEQVKDLQKQLGLVPPTATT